MVRVQEVNNALVSATRMAKGLEGRRHEEGLRSLGLFSPEAEQEQADVRPHGGLQLPHEGSGGAGAELCSLGTATGPEGTAWSWDTGGLGWGLGKGSAPQRVVGHWNRLPREVVMAQSCSRSIWIMLSDTWSDFGVVLCVARSCIR